MPFVMKAETFQETKERLIDAALWLIGKRSELYIEMQGKKRGKFAYFLHVLKNVATEYFRRNAQVATNIIIFGIPLLIILFKW